MYQLGLSPAATAEVPTSMSAVALGANRWASRVVVVLQLAAWSAVGIVLLQKGVSSLQKIPVDVNNVTKTNYTETTSANLIMEKITVPEEAANAEDILSDREHSELLKFNRDNNLIKNQDHGDELIDRKSIPGVIPISNYLTPNHLSVDKIESVWKPDRGSIQNGGNLNNNNNNNNNNLYPREKVEDEFAGDDATESTTAFSSFSPPFSNNNNRNNHKNNNNDNNEISTSTVKYDKVFETRKKIRMANSSGGGAAAAAVAMVAVGAVMLVLGPVVIILRALDERRQERRFLKLSGQDDLPPSYEQATLMDEAPRYSTLSLNTINCGSSSAVAAAGGTVIPAAETNSRTSRIANDRTDSLESMNQTNCTAGEIHRV